LVEVTDLSESGRYPLPAGRGHSEPAGKVEYVPQPDKPGAMLGGNYRWRVKYRALADRKE